MLAFLIVRQEHKQQPDITNTEVSEICVFKIKYMLFVQFKYIHYSNIQVRRESVNIEEVPFLHLTFCTLKPYQQKSLPQYHQHSVNTL